MKLHLKHLLVFPDSHNYTAAQKLDSSEQKVVIDTKMSDPQVTDLKKRSKILRRQQLKDRRDSSDASLLENQTRQQGLVAKLKKKELECESLRIELQNNIVAFAKFKKETRREAHMQQNAIFSHSEQLQSLRNLAEQDRVWLVEESERRISASAALRKSSQERLDSVQRRCSTDW